MQLVFRLHRADHLVAPDDLGEIEAFQAAQAVLLDAAPGHRRAGAHLGLEKIAGFPAHLGVLLRQVAGKQQHGHQAGQQGPRPHHEEVEHAERLGPILMRKLLTMRLVEVPIRVSTPPKVAAKHMGNSSREGAWLGLRLTAPSMDATTAVLLTNADRKAVENHTFTSTLLKEPVPTRLANQLMTRVFSTAERYQQQQHQGQQGAGVMPPRR